MATIIPMTIAGIMSSPIPKGIKAIIITNPMMAPITVNETFNSTIPIFNAATINTKNATIPKNIFIFHISHVLLYYILFCYCYITHTKFKIY